MAYFGAPFQAESGWPSIGDILTLDFLYKVGRWAGSAFLKLLLGAQGLHEQP